MMKALTKKRNDKGFTLVELIVVIAILAVLMAILVPQYIQYVERSRQGTDASGLGELKHAIETEAALNTPGSGVVTIEITNTTTGKATIAIPAADGEEGANATLNTFLTQVAKIIDPAAADNTITINLQSGACKPTEERTLYLFINSAGVVTWGTNTQTFITHLTQGSATNAEKIAKDSAPNT